jgi:predicted acylesterase/phospholipase RssA
MNSFKKIDLNYKTHPNLSLIKTLEMSSAVPVLFKPIIEDDKCYVDGSLFDNYPLNECLYNEKCNTDEILGIKNKWSNTEQIINNEMNIFQYLQASMNKIVKHIQINSTPVPIRYELKCLCDKKLADLSTWFEYMTNGENMKELIEEGKSYAELFLHYEKELGQCAI